MIHVNAGYLFSLNHARLVVLMATVYSIYCVKVRVGWHGVFLSINLAFLSNDVLSYLLQCCDNVNESTPSTEQKESESATGDEYLGDSEFSSPCEEPEKVESCKSSNKPPVASSIIVEKKELSTSKVVREEATSVDEMKRIMSSADHYEALGFPRQKKIDAMILKKEYRKKVCAVYSNACSSDCMNFSEHNWNIYYAIYYVCLASIGFILSSLIILLFQLRLGTLEMECFNLILFVSCSLNKSPKSMPLYG